MENKEFLDKLRELSNEIGPKIKDDQTFIIMGIDGDGNGTSSIHGTSQSIAHVLFHEMKTKEGIAEVFVAALSAYNEWRQKGKKERTRGIEQLMKLGEAIVNNMPEDHEARQQFLNLKAAWDDDDLEKAANICRNLDGMVPDDELMNMKPKGEA